MTNKFRNSELSRFCRDDCMGTRPRARSKEAAREIGRCGRDTSRPYYPTPQHFIGSPRPAGPGKGERDYFNLGTGAMVRTLRVFDFDLNKI